MSTEYGKQKKLVNNGLEGNEGIRKTMEKKLSLCALRMEKTL